MGGRIKHARLVLKKTARTVTELSTFLKPLRGRNNRSTRHVRNCAPPPTQTGDSHRHTVAHSLSQTACGCAQTRKARLSFQMLIRGPGNASDIIWLFALVGASVESDFVPLPTLRLWNESKVARYLWKDRVLIRVA